MLRALYLFRTSCCSSGFLFRKCGLNSPVLLQKQVHCQNTKSYSQQCLESSTPKEKAKVRRAYALGGCFIFMWLGTHAILLYRRRSEHRESDRKLPPIPWVEFQSKYLASGEVKSIVYQPAFGTGNVYLHSQNEQEMKNALHINPPDKFSRPPDVRFYFEGDEKEIESTISAINKTNVKDVSDSRQIEFSIDQFPSKGELGFIIAASLFAIGAITLVK